MAVMHYILKTYNHLGEISFRPKFFEPKVEEELYDLINDPHETVNLATNKKYKKILKTMRGYLHDWQQTHHDHGLDSINLEHAPPPKAPAVIDWLKAYHPEEISAMENGV